MYPGCRPLAIAPLGLCAPHRLRWAPQISSHTGWRRPLTDSPWCGIIFDKHPGRLYAAPGRPLRPESSGAARGGLAFRASPRQPEGSLGGEGTTTMRAPQRLTTALKAFRDVCVLWLQRWRRCWSRSRPAVDVKWVAGARDENRLDMIDRRRPQPWTHAERSEIINEGLLIIVGKCVLLAGYRGKILPAPVCLLTEARSRLRV